MSKKRWKAQRRKNDEWWLTDGTESFRMMSEFIAKMLAGYLNAPRP